MTKQDTISQAHLAAGRAVDQLRRQLGIVLEEDSGTWLGAVPIEGLTPELYQQLQKTRPCLLITGARARGLGMKTTDVTVRVDVDDLPLPTLLAFADPLNDQPIPKNIKTLPTSPSHDMLLTMAKYSSLLPAMLVTENDTPPANWLRVKMADVVAYWAAPPLDIVTLAQAALPIAGAENAALTCFRMRYGTSTHLALTFGNVSKEKNPLVRIHSSCITGDILGSLRCDCGSQLQLAIDKISAEGTGVLLYLHQEGRGIGIANKLRAYALQERGVDTFEANLMLGFEEDERDFSIAAAMLKQLGVQHCRLLTNNPQKIEALKKFGIDISERLPLPSKTGQHNHAYIEAKAKKSGHLF
jgi:GTP cyclohydrolase II